MKREGTSGSNSSGSNRERKRKKGTKREREREVLKKGGGRDGNCASKCPIPLLELFNY